MQRKITWSIILSFFVLTIAFWGGSYYLHSSKDRKTPNSQQGKCRYCRQKISWQYPMVELATGLLFLVIVRERFDFGLGSARCFSAG
jgi:sensor domain CHASE-containing protein